MICTYHPAYLLRNPAAKRHVWDDMKMLMVGYGYFGEGGKAEGERRKDSRSIGRATRGHAGAGQLCPAVMGHLSPAANGEGGNNGIGVRFCPMIPITPIIPRLSAGVQGSFLSFPRCSWSIRPRKSGCKSPAFWWAVPAVANGVRGGSAPLTTDGVDA